MSVSVAMAVYRGGTYLSAQIQSILPQLDACDELVVSLDAADTESEALLAPYQDDARVRVLRATARGVVPNFENALSHCQNEIVFLCDQDDVWIDHKVKTVLAAFDADPELLLVTHDAVVSDVDLQQIAPSFFAQRGVRHGVWKNMVKNSYMGCCMAFRRTLLVGALPFPKTIPMHDQWLGLLAEKAQKSLFLEKRLLLWRRHGANASRTEHSSLWSMLRFRVGLLTAWIGTARRRRRFLNMLSLPKGEAKK